MRLPSHRRQRVVRLLGCWLAGGSLLAAQSPDGALRVTVVDPSGGVVVGARVAVSGAHERGPSQRDGITDQAGDLLLSRLERGEYRMLVEAPGFEPRALSGVHVGSGERRCRVTLAIARVVEEVDVGRDSREAGTDPRGDGFTTVLDPDQIAALPDDPEALEQAVRLMAGPGAIIRVDGFRGGRMPPKHRIQRIRFRRNLFAAERHEAGIVAVDIVTRPGLGQWQGSLEAGGRGGPLGARHAYATTPAVEGSLRVGFTLDGPIVGDRTSVSLAVDGRSTSDVQTIRAALPAGLFTGTVPRPTAELGFTGRLSHALTSAHAIWVEVQHTGIRSDGLGVGEFDLPERAFARTDVADRVRLSEQGPVGRRAYGEFRLEVGSRKWAEASMTQAPTLVVPQAFTAGGAQRAGGRVTREVELAADVDVALGRRHVLRAGTLLEGGWYRTDARRNEAGTWTFSSLTTLAAASPATFTQRLGDPRAAFSVARVGHYLQDDLRAGKGLTVTLGLRHEWQRYVADTLAVSPRAGVTWSPFADGRTTVRGGAGFFRAWLDAEVLAQLFQVDGRRQLDVIIESPGYPDPWTGGAARVLPPSRYEMARDLRLPRILQVSGGVERQMAPTATLSATYVYVHGSHQFRGRDVNAPDANGRRSDPHAGRIVQVESTARSAGHVLSVSLNGTAPARRLFLTAMYSLAWRHNEADGPLDLPSDAGAPSADWGPATSDVRHQVTALVAAPLGAGLLAGLQVRASSGSPYNVTTGFDDNQDGVLNDRPAGLGRNSGRGEGLFDLGVRLAWSRGFGHRNGRDRPPDGPLPLPTIPRWRLEVSLSATNATNAVNRMGYSGVMTSPFFGQASAALPARRIDVGARIGF